MSILRCLLGHAYAVGNRKAEANQIALELETVTATTYNRPDNYVFATDAPRACKKGDKQPVWLSKVMQYQFQPAAKRVGITKRIGWHTFRHAYTTLLHANGEDVKVLQEQLRHGSARITMDVYAQAATPAKPKAQGKVVAMLRDTEKKTS